MKKILITYATKTDTTKELAEELAKYLKKDSLQIDVLPIEEVVDTFNYDGVIIGSPINGMRWLPTAVKFVEENSEDLVDVPVAYFLVSYLLNDGARIWRNSISKSLANISDTVKPVSTGMFTGRIEKQFPWILRKLFGINKNLKLDLVDFTQVEEWSKYLKVIYK